MRIAKLEIKLVLAVILLGYEYELVDGKGNYPKAVPKQNRNDLHQVSNIQVDESGNLYFCLVEAHRRPVLSQIQTHR
jgi:sterol 14-demethylase